jgi:exo-1,4-beta-D-glucosaminidase
MTRRPSHYPIWLAWLAVLIVASCTSTEDAHNGGPSGSGGASASSSTGTSSAGPGTNTGNTSAGPGTSTGAGGDATTGAGSGGAPGGPPDGSAGSSGQPDASIDAGCSSCTAGTTLLQNGWTIQASNAVSGATGKQISTVGFATAGWYPVSVPTTVLAGLVANKVYPDPYIGDNMTKIPASIGATSWWYRLEFTPSADFNGQAAWLALEGVNYRANVWLNGQSVATSSDVVGTFTNYEWNITSLLHAGVPNALAVEVLAPDLMNDLALSWLDWNPAPPDKDMGIWREVYLRRSGPVAVRSTHVTTKVDPSLASAELTIKANVINTTAQPVHATITGTVGSIAVSQDVDLMANETRAITFDPAANASLKLANPRLWWPVQMGTQEMYGLTVAAKTNGADSDSQSVQFGIRSVTSSLTTAGYRLFTINGKRVLIRGGGWASDMMLRLPAERLDAQFQYVRDMGLNAIRIEGKFDFDELYATADQYGIMIIPGWMCCDHWQDWGSWSAADHKIAVASMTTQAERMRNHPSVIDFLVGSDETPPANVESEFVNALQAADWPNPIGSSAADRTGATLGKSGMKMPGPYDWVAPSYWMLDKSNGGGFGFNSEAGPGPSIPEIDSIQTMLNASQQSSLWTMLSASQYHAGTAGLNFSTLSIFNAALSARHGAPKSLEDYVRKAQLMNYEAERAPYEAYGRNKYTSATGYIHWMLNNAWPSLIWHLYGSDLVPAAAYFGAKKGNEPLHILYSYDNASVVVVNHTQQAAMGLAASVRVYNLDASQKYANDSMVSVPADGTASVVTIPTIAGLSGTYFVVLSLSQGGSVVSNNFYWLSTTAETNNFGASDWFHTPTSTYANYTALSTLPMVGLTATASASQAGATGTTKVTLTNSSASVAMFIRLKLTSGKGGKMVVPVFWQDNYVSLMPGESRTISASYAVSDLGGAAAAVEVSGWNVTTQVVGG